MKTAPEIKPALNTNTSNLSIGSTVELNIDSLAMGGKGVARSDGLVFFVERALPTQKVVAQITAIKSNLCEASLVSVLSHSTDETSPECPHFEVCGGCDWQHLKYPAQLVWKRQIFIDCLTRLGKQNSADIEALKIDLPQHSPDLWSFRNKMEFAFAPQVQNDQNDAELSSMRPLLGLRRKAQHSVEEITQCRLQTPLTMRILEITRQWMDEEIANGQKITAWVDKRSRAPQPAQNMQSRPEKGANSQIAALRYLVIREPQTSIKQVKPKIDLANTAAKTEQDQANNSADNSAKQCLVEIITAPFNKREAIIFKRLGVKLTQILEKEYGATLSFGFLHSVRANPVAVAQGEKIIQSMGVVTLCEQLGELNLKYSPHSFMQTNTKTSTLLVNKATEWVLESNKNNKIIWDLYCGVGSFALSVASAFKKQDLACQIFGMELSAKAIYDANKNAELNSLEDCTFVAADAEKALLDKELMKEWIRPDLIIIDPPRAGIKEALCKQIMALAPKELILVSCNPATLGRDIASLSKHYKIAKAQIFDMFPHSAHLESVLLLKRVE